jgi:rare lipoprotein A
MRPCIGRFLFLVGLLASTSFGCATGGGPSGRPATTLASRQGSDTQIGVASYYAHRFHGRRTAYGDIYDERELTAAHPSLPNGTKVRVTNLANGSAVVLRVNDRGPWGNKRVIDVSYAAAKRLGFVREGLTRVRIEVAAVKEDEERDEEEE